MTTAKNNPFRVNMLGSYDLTQKGRFQENLDILSAMKATQNRFLKRIVHTHPDEVKRQNDLHRCGSWIFMRHYPETGHREFAGGYTCNSPFCMPCNFRKAYVAARACHDAVVKIMAKNPRVKPLFFLQEPLYHDLLQNQFRHLVSFYGKYLKQRSKNIFGVLGSIGGYCITRCDDCSEWHTVVKEIMLVDVAKIGDSNIASDVSGNLFPAILDVFLGAVANADGRLTRNQQYEVADLIRNTRRYIGTGCLTDFQPPEIWPVDQQEQGHVEKVFFEEQYRWNADQEQYELEEVNSGENMLFPLKGSIPLTSHRSSQYRKRQHNRAVRRESFAQVLEAL